MKRRKMLPLMQLIIAQAQNKKRAQKVRLTGGAGKAPDADSITPRVSPS